MVDVGDSLGLDEPANGLKGCSSKHHRRRDEKVAACQVRDDRADRVVPGGRARRGVPVAGVDAAMSVHEARRSVRQDHGLILELRDLVREFRRWPGIIAFKYGHQGSGAYGECRRVDTPQSTQSLVRAPDNRDPRIRERLGEVGRTVGRSIIDNDQFPVLECLSLDAPDACIDESGVLGQVKTDNVIALCKRFETLPDMNELIDALRVG